MDHTVFTITLNSLSELCFDALGLVPFAEKRGTSMMARPDSVRKHESIIHAGTPPDFFIVVGSEHAHVL